MEDSDAVLWPRALDGDDRAFAEIFDRHADRVHRHALRFSANRQDAEDVTALVFLEAWRLRGRVRIVNGSVIGWLLVTAANIARNGSRTRARHERLLRDLRPQVVPDHSDAVLGADERARVQLGVREAFARLSVKDQEILALCVLEELAPQDVAAVLRVSPGTVRTRLSRAKARLRAIIGDRTWEGEWA